MDPGPGNKPLTIRLASAAVLLEMSNSKEKEFAAQLAKVFAILGGLLIIMAGALQLTSLVTKGNVATIESLVTTLGYGLLNVTLGIVAIAGSKHLKSILWGIVLIIAGVVAYPIGGGSPWGFGPVIVIIAGLIGIIAELL